MKRIAIFFVVSLLGTFLLSATSVFAASQKYAYINVAKVFDEYQKTQDDNRNLQEVGKEKEKERDVLVHDIRQLKDELVLLSDDSKMKKQEQLDEKIRELQAFDQSAKRGLGEKRNEMIRNIFKDIDDVVQRYGERKGLDLIFSDRALLYHSEKYNVTDEVLKELNKNYKKK